MSLVLFFVAYTYAFFAVYILVMGIQRAHLSGRLVGPIKWLCMPMVGVGYAMDAFANLTLASLLFLERPHEWLVTARLQRHMLGNGWRAKLAHLICDHLLDPLDPSGDHC